MKKTIYYCDRCGKEVQVLDFEMDIFDYQINATELCDDGTRRYKGYELCKMCGEDFKNFMKGMDY